MCYKTIQRTQTRNYTKLPLSVDTLWLYFVIRKSKLGSNTRYKQVSITRQRQISCLVIT